MWKNIPDYKEKIVENDTNIVKIQEITNNENYLYYLRGKVGENYTMCGKTLMFLKT